MINCPKCNTDNQIGAIFCRGCGERLDLDEVRPEAVQEAARAHEGKEVNYFAIIKNIVVLVILIILVIFLLGLFMAPSMRAVDELSEKQKTRARSMYKRWNQGQFEALSYNTAELNYMATDLFDLTDEELRVAKKERLETGETGLSAIRVHIEVLKPGKDDNRVKIVVKQQHTKWSWYRMYIMIVVHIEASKKGVRLTVKKSSMGKIPTQWLPFAHDIVIERFKRTIEGKAPINKLQKRIRRIEVREDKVTVGRSSKKPRD